MVVVVIILVDKNIIYFEYDVIPAVSICHHSVLLV